jgi:hypothetical protein
MFKSFKTFASEKMRHSRERANPDFRTNFDTGPEDGGLRCCYRFRVNVHEYASTYRSSRGLPQHF